MTLTEPRGLLTALLAATALVLGCGGDDQPRGERPRDAASTAPAAPRPLGVEGGTTTFRPAASARQLLGAVGAEVEPIDPASRKGRAFAFPVSGGRVAADGESGKIRHAGGLRLRFDGRTGVLRRPVIDLARGVLTAEINGERVTALRLDLAGAKRTRSEGSLVLEGVEARLTAQAVERLRRRLGPVGALALAPVTGGDPVATLTVRAEGRDGG